MAKGYQVFTTYIGNKFYTARIDNTSIDPDLFKQIIEDNTNIIICSHYVKPDQWDKNAKGSATYCINARKA